MSEDRVYTVSELQGEVRTLLEGDYRSIWVEGEISGLRLPRHAYFTLKDSRAQLSAVIWASTLDRMRFEPEDGLAVRARGHLTLYEPSGRYQMIISRLEPLGAGPLQVKFEQLKKRLAAEGLFDEEHKQPLPLFPRRIALVTSPTGAAVRDFIHVARRRWPAVELVVVATRVQGAGAAESIAEALAAADAGGFDVILVGRGGGSLEDLWAFNEEPVARAVFGLSTPVVSAVGHEVDWSICDFVADLRAATPSAAAERVTPDRAQLRRFLDERRQRLGRGLSHALLGASARLAALRASRPFARPAEHLVHDREQRLDGLRERLAGAVGDSLARRRRHGELLAGRLDALSPLKVLGRGYSLTTRQGRVLTSVRDASPGDQLKTRLADGELRSRVL